MEILQRSIEAVKYIEDNAFTTQAMGRYALCAFIDYVDTIMSIYYSGLGISRSSPTIEHKAKGVNSRTISADEFRLYFEINHPMSDIEVAINMGLFYDSLMRRFYTFTNTANIGAVMRYSYDTAGRVAIRIYTPSEVRYYNEWCQEFQNISGEQEHEVVY